MNILDSTQKKSGKLIILILVLLCLPANLIIACNDISKTDNDNLTENRTEVKMNSTVKVTNEETNKETVNADVEKMLPVFRAITGFLMEGKKYDSTNDATYWVALDMAVNEHVRSLDNSIKSEGNYYKVSPKIIEEVACVLFPDRPNYKEVPIASLQNNPYARYDAAQNAYYVLIGELGLLSVDIGNITDNSDGTVTVTVNAIDGMSKESLGTFSFTLVKNKNANDSNFVYSIKSAK